VAPASCFVIDDAVGCSVQVLATSRITADGAARRHC
jgi:hypothetical protein